LEAPSNTDAASIRLKKLRKRKIITITAILLFVLIVAAVIIKAHNARANRQNALAGMVTAKVGRATITQKISATGSVTAQTGAQINVGSQITGRIKNLYVDVGSRVKAGQTIAVLDLPDIKAQYDQAEAALGVAEQNYAQQQTGVGFQQTTTATDISKAQAALASARATYNQDSKTAGAQVKASETAVTQAQATYQNAISFLNREKQLLDKGYVAAQDVDNAQTQVNVAAAQLDAAKQNLILTQTKTSTTVQTDMAAVRSAEALLSAARAETAQNTIKPPPAEV